jgi:hypothetical protein
MTPRTKLPHQSTYASFPSRPPCPSRVPFRESDRRPYADSLYSSALATLAPTDGRGSGTNTIPSFRS